MSRRIVLTGGLSGGHTYPLIAVSRALRELSQGKSNIEFLYIGSKGQFEKEAMEKEGIPMRFIWTAKWRRYFSFQNFIDFFKFPVAMLQALWHLFLFMPDAVFAKGGAVSVPVVLAAWIFRIPVMLHDSDAVAGRANRLLAVFATRISIAYDYARKYFPPDKVAMTGNPIRTEILGGDRDRARESYRTLPDQPVILVIGGSLGAKALNEAFVEVLPEILRKKMSVIHVTGANNYADVVRMVGEKGIMTDDGKYVAKPFLDATKLADAYILSDLVVSRAGAGSVAEIAAVKKAAILVPLASAANDEQRMNAYEVAENGGAMVLEEANLGPHILSERISELMNDEKLRQQMADRLHRFYHPSAARDIAQGILDMLS